MRILFLDDSEARWDMFWRANYEQHECRWAKDVAQATAGLDADPQFDLATLDHDLADEHYQGACGVGCELAKKLGDGAAKLRAARDAGKN